MQVKCTKVFAKELNSIFNGSPNHKGYNAVCQRGTDFWGVEKKVITIYYPANYYACPLDLDDFDLLRIFKQSDRTYNGFFDSLLEYVEI